jgi:hypothetical protein
MKDGRPMRKRFLLRAIAALRCCSDPLGILTAAALLLLSPAAAQDDEALSRWGQSTGDALIHFLPNAQPWGFSPDPAPIFNAFANDVPHKYITLVVHKSWWFDDSGLSRQMADLQKEKQALKQEQEKASEEFQRDHGAEMQALEKTRVTEMQTLSKQAEDLFMQGKYEEGKAVMEKIKPFHYPPSFESVLASFDKRQQELTDREQELSRLRRQVSFRIYTNRTPSTTAFAYPAKAIGTLAGRTLYRQSYILKMEKDHETANSNLAVFLGPPGYQNPHVTLAEWQPKVKCIVVWVWIESLPDKIQADEATVKKVLESVDYDGLSKLIQP